MAIWPDSLPQKPLAQGYQRTPDELRLSFRSDAGVEENAPRVSKVPKFFNCVFEFTQAQLERFEYFYETELGIGSLPYTWTDPSRGDQGSFKIRSWSETELGPDTLRVNCVIERII